MLKWLQNTLLIQRSSVQTKTKSYAERTQKVANSGKNTDSAVKIKGLVTIKQAASILNVSIDTVRRWDKAGKVSSTRPNGKNRYFSLKELEKVKLQKPLLISEAAQMLKVSSSTLRRLEKRGLVSPIRNKHGVRRYSHKTLHKFLNSEYFIRQKGVEEEVLQLPNAQTKNRGLIKQPGVGLAIKRLVSEDHRNILRLRWRLGLALGISAAVLAPIVILVAGLASAFLINPGSTAKRLGLVYLGSTDQAQASKVKAASTDSTQDPSKPVSSDQIKFAPSAGWKNDLRPFVNVALFLVRHTDSQKYAVAAHDLQISDVNSVFQPDEKGGIRSLYPLSLGSGKLSISDPGLVFNLNSDLLHGKRPGNSSGDIAVLPLSGGPGGGIANASITTTDIANGAITSNKLAPALRSSINVVNTSYSSTGTILDSSLSPNVSLQGNSFNGVNQLVQLTAAGILPVLNGTNLTSLNGTNISSGTLADARLSTNVTLQGNTFNIASQLVQLTSGGLLPVLNGSNLTNLSASNISSGNFVASITNGLGISGGNGGSNGAALTLAVNQAASLSWTGTETFATLTSTGASTIATGSSLTNTFGSGTSTNNTIGGGASSVNTIGSATTPGALTLRGIATFTNLIQGSAGLDLLGTTSGGVVTAQPLLNWRSDNTLKWQIGLDVANSVNDDFAIARGLAGGGVADIIYLKDVTGTGQVAIGLSCTPPASVRVQICGASNAAANGTWPSLQITQGQGQTGDALKMVNSAGNGLAKFDTNGALYGVDTAVGTYGLKVVPTATGNVALTVRGLTSQTADVLQVISNSSSTLGIHFAPDGNDTALYIKNTSDGSTNVSLRTAGSTFTTADFSTPIAIASSTTNSTRSGNLAFRDNKTGGAENIFVRKEGTGLSYYDNGGTLFVSMNTTGGSGSLSLQGGGTLSLLSTSTSAVSLDSGTTGNVNIGTGANAKTIQIGNTTGGVAQTINIGNNATASSTNTVTIGNLLGTSATTIQGGTGASAIGLQAGAGGTISIGTTNNNNLSLNTAAVAGTTTIGGTATTGTITLGQSTATNTISIGGAAGNLNTQTINIGNSATAGSTTNLVLGSTVAGTTTLQSAGGIAVSTLGTANTVTYLCRNSSNLIGTCQTTATGSAFLQGGNSFGATAVLGTNDNFGLNIRTNSLTQATITATGATTFQNSTNSTTAFQVQNLAASTVLDVDTTNSRVGIGTTTPFAKLDVDNKGTNGSGVNTVMRLTGGPMATANDATRLLFTQRNSPSDDYGGAIQLTTTQTSPSFLNPRLDFLVQQSNTNALTSMGTMMTILGSGNVGIGTTGPSNTLHVAGTALFKPGTDSTTALQVQPSGSTTPALDVDTTNSRVGVNTAAPGARFHVVDGTGNIVVGSPYSGLGGIGFGSSFSGNNYSLLGEGTNTFLNAPSGTIYFRQNNVTVGSFGTNGAALFQNSANSVTAFQVQNLAGNNYIQVDTSGANLNLGSGGIASTVQIGNTTGAVAQTINIGNNAIALSTTTITLGSTVGASATTIQAGTGEITLKGHLKATQTTAPTAGTPTACGTTPTAAVTAGSTDNAGSFTITAGTGAPGSCVVIITFNAAFAGTPKAILLQPTTAVGSATGGKTANITASAAGSFTATMTGTAPLASEVNSYYYWVIE
ncbi:hypothetical protein BVY00_00415 [bacterium G20]|nr:hypothetical protein BVY00_00415 [bacterium G20]